MDAATLFKKTEQHIYAGHKKFKAHYNNNTNSTLRLFKSVNGDICEFKKGSTRRGYILNFSNITSIDPIVKRKSEAQIWQESWQKVRNRLAKSGLWHDILKNIDIALEMGYDKIKSASDEYWTISYDERIRPEKVKKYIEKYPLLDNGNGNGDVNTCPIWNMSRKANVEKMRFYEGERNQYALNQIARAFEHRHDFSTHGRTNYDISFEYKPLIHKAWYSKEYKGCGNGHYYLALDATHAVYWEKD